MRRPSETPGLNAPRWVCQTSLPVETPTAAEDFVEMTE